jgi:hypothetical protein
MGREGPFFCHSSALLGFWCIRMEGLALFTLVLGRGFLRRSALPWCSDVLCAIAHIHSASTGVWC